jgi:hypothetical protein
VPFGRSSPGLLHGDGDDVAQKRTASEGGEGEHGLVVGFGSLSPLHSLQKL